MHNNIKTRPPRPVGRSRHTRYLVRYVDHRYADLPTHSIHVREHDLFRLGYGGPTTDILHGHVRREHLVSVHHGRSFAVADAYGASLVAYGLIVLAYHLTARGRPTIIVEGVLREVTGSVSTRPGWAVYMLAKPGSPDRDVVIFAPDGTVEINPSPARLREVLYGQAVESTPRASPLTPS